MRHQQGLVGEMLGRGFGPIRHIPLPIEVPVLEGYPVNEFGFDHSRSLGCSEGAEDRGVGQAFFPK
jgi:hypothetical protein